MISGRQLERKGKFSCIVEQQVIAERAKRECEGGYTKVVDKVHDGSCNSDRPEIPRSALFRRSALSLPFVSVAKYED